MPATPPTHQRHMKNICQGDSEASQCLGWRNSPFQQCCVCVFSSLRTTYTSIFPFSLVATAVFTGSGSQPCLAAFPLLLFSFYLHLHQEPKALPSTLWRGLACVPLSAPSCTSCLGIFSLSVPIPAAFWLGFVMVS